MVYGCFLRSAKIWGDLNDEIFALRKGQRIVHGGLQMATDFMVQGDLSIIPSDQHNFWRMQCSQRHCLTSGVRHWAGFRQTWGVRRSLRAPAGDVPGELPCGIGERHHLHNPGASFYTFGDRKAYQLESYFRQAADAFKSIAKLCNPDTCGFLMRSPPTGASAEIT